MRAHHTKDKGDLGVLRASVDWRRRLRSVAPLSEHAPFDLVAYKDGRVLRVQVKYRAAVNGAVVLMLRSAWADRHGTHTVPLDKAAIDLICIYCPDTQDCYYFDPRTVERSINLRITPARNAQTKRVRWASDFACIPAQLERPGGS